MAPRGLLKCYVCGRKHDKGEYYKFPDDMPLKFRWCCNCRSYASVIAEWDGGIELLIKRFKQEYGIMKRILFIKRAKLLNELLTVG